MTMPILPGIIIWMTTDNNMSSWNSVLYEHTHAHTQMCMHAHTQMYMHAHTHVCQVMFYVREKSVSTSNLFSQGTITGEDISKQRSKKV